MGSGGSQGGVSCCGDFERRRRENFVIFNTVVKGNPSIERAAGAKLIPLIFNFFKSPDSPPLRRGVQGGVNP